MSGETVAVIDYGMGNLHSVASAVESVGSNVRVQVTADRDTILAADRVIFPGVGAIRDCMAEIRRLGIDEVVHAVADGGQPMLAICVGMQALMSHSEENGGVDCLDVFPGAVRFFGNPLCDAQGDSLKVPHMGWNQVSHTLDHPLWAGIDDMARFYFVHSYYVESAQEQLIAGTVDYGSRFAAALWRDNVFAVQFHPEKSSPAGLVLLANFLQWDGKS
jgi:glutamine amidotransferase